MLMLLIRRRGLSLAVRVKMPIENPLPSSQFPRPRRLFPVDGNDDDDVDWRGRCGAGLIFPQPFSPAFPRVFPQPGLSTLAALA